MSTPLQAQPPRELSTPTPFRFVLPSHLRAVRRDIRRIERYVPPFADRSVTNLSLNEHPAAPAPEVYAALREVEPLRLVTYDTEWVETLRARLAEREGVLPGNIVLCPGSAHALQLLFACLSDGGPALYPSICWSYYHGLARLNGLHVSTYDVVKADAEFQVDPHSVARALQSEEPSVLLFINPHMPTGALVDDDFILSCAASAGSSLILVDEAYHGFSPAAGSLASRVQEQGNLVVAKTFSKFFGLAGLRVGYLVAHASVVEQLDKAVSPFSIPYLSSRLACAALEGEPYYHAQARMLLAVKEAFARRVAALPGLKPYRSHGNFLLVEFPAADDATRAEEQLYTAGVAVRSARSYGLSRCLRISVGSAEIMDRVAAVLEERHGAR